MFTVSQPYQQFFNASGYPLNGGLIYIGYENTNPVIPTNQIPVFWDSDATQPAAQPITTINGYPVRNGSPAQIFVNSACSMAVYDKNKTLIFYSRTVQTGSSLGLYLDITGYDGAGFVGGFPSYDALRLYKGDRTRIAVVGIGIWGDFYIDTSDLTSPDDGGATIVDALGRRWKRISWKSVTPEMFGQVTTPESTAIAFNSAAEYCRASGAKLVKGLSSYIIGADVNLRSISTDFSGCEITVVDGVLLIIGGDAGTTINPEQIFGIIKKPRAWSFIPDDYPNPTVRCMGSKGQTVRISQVDRLQFYQSTNPATYPKDASQAYSKFFIDFATVIGIDTDPAYDGGASVDGPGTANQWFNENQFYLGRNVSFYFRGSYRHNNNRIHGGCYETQYAYINIQSGNKNWFTDIRAEGSTSIVFGVNTLGNIVDVNWFSSEAQIYQRPPAAGTFIDNGVLNIIRDTRLPPTASDCVFIASVKDVIHNGQPSNYNFRLATRRAIRSSPRTTARIVSDSDFIDAEYGDYFFTSAESIASTTSSYILRIYLYDKEFNVIAANIANLETGNFNTVFSTWVEGRINNAVAHQRFGILNSDVRYVRVVLLTSGSTSEDNALRIQINRVSRMPGRSRKSSIKNSKAGRFDIVTSAPTTFLGNVSYFIGGTTSDYRCVFALETTLASSSSSTATVLTPTSTTLSGLGAVAIGDLVGIDLNDGDTYWTTISAIGGGTITIPAPGLPSAAFAGNKIYFSRLSPR